MNNDNRIRNRMLDIYSDLARYTHMNQMHTNDTIQRIESGIRELNSQGESLPNTDNTPRYPFNTMNRNNNDPGTNTNTWAERIYRNSNDRTVPNVRNNFNSRSHVAPRTYTMNNRSSNNTRRARPNIIRPTNIRLGTNNVTDNGARMSQLTNTDFFNQFFNMFNTDLNNLTPVTVRPTHAQIANATELININESMINTTCPILQTSFQEGDRISRIKHCGHCFIEEGLMVWFNQSVLCPVCRYDIRDYPIEPTPVVPVDPIQRVDPVPHVPRVDPVQPIQPIQSRSSTNESDISNNLTNTRNNMDTFSTTNSNSTNNLLDLFTNQISNTFQQYLITSDLSFNNFNNRSIDVDYFVQTPTNIYTTSTPNILFTNNFELRNNETLEDDDDEEEVEDVVVSDEELIEEEYIDE